MGLCSSQSVPTSRERQNSIYNLHNIVDQLRKQQQELENLSSIQERDRQAHEKQRKELEKERESALEQLQEFQEQFLELKQQLSMGYSREEDSFLDQLTPICGNSDVKHLEQKNKELLDQITEFKLTQQKVVLRNIARINKRMVKFNFEEALKTWKLEVFSTDVSTLDTDLVYWIDDITIQKGEILRAQHLFDKENQGLLQKNILWNNYQAGKPPMKRANLFKFFEEMMEKKFEADLNDLESERPWRPLNEFMLDHLVRAYGLKSLAQKVLNQIIPCLQELFIEKHPYGLIICRLLHIFHSQPILLPLAVFLTKARVEFNKIASEPKPQSRIPQMVQQVKQISYQGRAQLADAINMVYSLFQNDRVSRGVSIKLLRPQQISHGDYLVFRISHKIVKMGGTSQQIFGLFDTRKTGILNKQALADGLRRVLELSVNNTELDTLFSVFDIDIPLTLERFTQIINLKDFYKNSKSPVFSVSKCQFLGSLIEAYTVMQIKDAVMLQKWLEIQEENCCTKQGFTQLILKLEPSLFAEQVEFLYLEGSESPEEFVKTVIKYGINDRGIRDFKIQTKSFRNRRKSAYFTHLTSFSVQKFRRQNSKLTQSSRNSSPPAVQPRKSEN